MILSVIHFILIHIFLFSLSTSFLSPPSTSRQPHNSKNISENAIRPFFRVSENNPNAIAARKVLPATHQLGADQHAESGADGDAQGLQEVAPLPRAGHGHPHQPQGRGNHFGIRYHQPNPSLSISLRLNFHSLSVSPSLVSACMEACELFAPVFSLSFRIDPVM